MISSIIRLVRPVNILIVTAVVAGTIDRLTPNISLSQIITAALIAAITLAGGNIINDIFDIEIDRINNPKRELPSGNISVPFALNAYKISILLSLVIAVFIGISITAFVLFIHVLLYLYSRYFKKAGITGNILISVVIGLTFIYAGIIAGKPQNTIILFLFAFTINLIRELTKDLLDSEGDREYGSRSFPIVYGTVKTRRLITILTLMLMAVTVISYFSGLLGIGFLVIVCLIVNPLLLYFLKLLYSDSWLQQLKSASKLLKLNMLFGLIAIIVSL